MTTVTCHAFSEEYIKSILKIVKKIEDKMLDNPTFDGLLNKLDIVFELIECSSTDYLTDGSGTEVHADSSSVAIIKVGNLDSSWSGQVSHTTSARRRNLATSDVCGIMFNAVPTNLASKSNLVMKIQYDQTCATQKTMCDSNYSQTANPKCCQLTVQSKTTDYSGAINMKTESVTSDQMAKRSSKCHPQGHAVLTLNACTMMRPISAGLWTT